MTRILLLCLCVIICWMVLGYGRTDQSASIQIVERPDTEPANDFYYGNRPPLASNPLVKLHITLIRPQGWLRKQLELQAEGFLGYLTEISRFLKKEDNAWLSPKGEGHSGWEEVPYWLKGFGDTGYLLNNRRVIKESRQWIDAVIASQREDGYFGPRSNLTLIEGKPDVWPNMIMLDALQSYYEYTRDDRVTGLMDKYFRWELSIPDGDFLLPFWQQQRAGDNLASVYWLYNRTDEKWLLELAEKIHRRTANWTGGIASWHGVNIAQCFREPAVFYQQSRDPKYLAAAERNYQIVRDIYGQVPGGLYGADENCREGYTDPRQATESCSMVEMMLSCEMLLSITGDPVWADRCEDVAFNSFPASMTPDLKALRYLTAPNMVLSDRKSKAPGLQNGGPMLLFDPHEHRCCQHNVGQGWSYFTEHLWMATPGNGLAAVLYAPCNVSAIVGNATMVTITETTRYPFDETVAFTLKMPRQVRFPLYLRVPGWCPRVTVVVGDNEVSLKTSRPGYIRIDKVWNDGDTVRLTLPMDVTITKWEKNKGSISVNRGPLTYSLKIGEKYVQAGGTEKWPAWEIYPTTAWNYALVLNESSPGLGFQVERKSWPSNNQPFELSSAPIELRTTAKKIPQWELDSLGLVGLLQESPVKTDQPIETVNLIPMGCALLRISAFPVVGSDPDAHQWQEPSLPLLASASHCWENDTLTALSDGMIPRNSNDRNIPRFTWWDHKGTTEWVQYDFQQLRQVSAVAVYWFDDTGRGGCRIPKSWQLSYKDGEQWKSVATADNYGVEKDTFNQVKFDSVSTTALRLEAQLQSGFSAGILEWKFE